MEEDLEMVEKTRVLAEKLRPPSSRNVEPLVVASGSKVVGVGYSIAYQTENPSYVAPCEVEGRVSSGFHASRNKPFKKYHNGKFCQWQL